MKFSDVDTSDEKLIIGRPDEGVVSPVKDARFKKVKFLRQSDQDLQILGPEILSSFVTLNSRGLVSIKSIFYLMVTEK